MKEEIQENRITRNLQKEVNKSESKEENVPKNLTTAGDKIQNNEEKAMICEENEAEIEELLVDSGCSSHMVNDSSKFIEFDENFKPDEHFLVLADGTKQSGMVEKKGTAIFHMRDKNGKVHETKLEGALYVPSYPQSLFSVKKATKQENATVVLRGEDGELITKNGVNFPIRSIGNLYYFNMCTQSTRKRTATLRKWHEILGHVNKGDILKLESVVEDMKITDKKEFDCGPCALGKQVVTRNRKADSRSKIPLNFVHSDLSGAVEPIAREGFKYAMNFVDDYSGSTFMYFLKYKSDAAKALKKFLADSAQYGTIKKLRADNGGEYLSGEFENILIESKISHESSAPYSPHQNGTAERNWRTIFEMARTILIESGLPKNLWTYAVMTAVHIRNRMYSERIKDTPYHLLVGKKPRISDLHVFGSVCYANVHNKKKLDARSKKGYFLGYDKYSASYLIYFPDTKTVSKNATVTFTDKFEEPEDVQPYQETIEYDEKENFEENQENEEETNENERRYPERVRNKPKYLEEYHCYNYDSCCYFIDKCLQLSDVPNSFTQAVTGNSSEEWRAAMDSEMDSLKENEVYTTTKLPAGKKAIPCRWVYSIKDNPNGEVIYKARLVAKGYSQVQGRDYSETFSPTAKMSTIRMIMQVSAENKMMVHHLDVRTAYLNAPIDCEVYLSQPEGYAVSGDEGEKLVWKLRKSLYGLKQSGRNWNFVLSEFFQKHDFKKSEIDPCLFYKYDGESKVYIVIWVDDIVLSVSRQREMESTKNLLKNKFHMKDLGPISYFLGIQFNQDPTTFTIDMCQEHYLKGVLARFNMADCRPKSTPCEVKLQAYENNDNEEDTEGDTRRYREIVGSLVYAMTCSRPDLSWIVTKLSSHLNNPTKADWMTVKHVLRYIKGTLNHKLVFRASKDGLKAIGFSDSDWASSKEDRKSTTGYCFLLNSEGPLISWKSKKQQTVALSSCEAEYMALTAATQEAIFISNLAEEFDIVADAPTPIFGDNQGSIALVKNPVSHEKSKHIDIKHHFVREKFNDGVIDVTYVPTKENVADLMTKAATKVSLDKFHRNLFGQMS